MRDLKWSPTAKAIALPVFERALRREMEAAIAEAKNIAANVEQPSDLWDLEGYLTGGAGKSTAIAATGTQGCPRFSAIRSGRISFAKKSCAAWRKTSFATSVCMPRPESLCHREGSSCCSGRPRRGVSAASHRLHARFGSDSFSPRELFSSFSATDKPTPAADLAARSANRAGHRAGWPAAFQRWGRN